MESSLDLEILKKTFDDLPVGVGIFKIHDPEDLKSIEYVFMNKVILFEMRKSKEEVFGKRIIEVAPEAYEHEAGVQVIKTYFKVAAEGDSINLGLVNYSNHMVAGTYECSVHHIADNFVYVMLRNVTELEQTKNELEHRNQELNQFAHMASHDLKEPLRTITGFSQMISDDYKDRLDEKANKLLNFIIDATGRMRVLIDDLLEHSSIGQNREKTEIDCNELVQTILQDLHTAITDNNAIIEVEELPTLRGYRTELRLLFQNLISNAIKFKNPGGVPKIEISAQEKNGWTFAIKDNGLGILEKNQEKIFKPFQRLHHRKDYKGTGIGLAHCKKIVDLHHGTIWVESELGEGSTFYFNIPHQLSF